MLKLVRVPSDVLNRPCKEVTLFNSDLIRTVVAMEKVLVSQVGPNLIGVGLAAPQVGIDRRLFIIKPRPKSDTEVFINARIVDSVTQKESEKETAQKTAKNGKKKKRQKLEGCLSIPHLWGPLKRAHKIQVEYQDIEGKPHTEWFFGFKAVIIQHEIDHTNGILFTQRVIEQKGQLYEEKNGELKKLDY